MLTAHPRGQENMVEIVERGPRSEKSTMYWIVVIPSDFGFVEVSSRKVIAPRRAGLGQRFMKDLPTIKLVLEVLLALVGLIGAVLALFAAWR